MIELEKASIQVLEPGMIENHIKAGCVLEVPDVIAIKKANMEASNHQPYVVLVTAGLFASISKEARDYVSSDKVAENTIAKAVVVDNLAKRIIGNFYVRFNKPVIPTSLFDNRKEAITWLKKCLKKAKAVKP